MKLPAVSKKLVGVLAMVIVLSSVLGLVRTPTASANDQQQVRYGDVTTHDLCPDVWPNCAVWGARAHVGYYYNGRTAWASFVDPTTWGYGFDVSVTWKGCVWQSSYLSCGLDVQVNALIKGFPISGSHGLRVEIRPNGTIQREYGW